MRTISEKTFRFVLFFPRAQSFKLIWQWITDCYLYLICQNKKRLQVCLEPIARNATKYSKIFYIGYVVFQKSSLTWNYPVPSNEK